MKRKKPNYGDFTRLVDTELSDYIQTKDIAYREAHLKTATKLSMMDFKSIPISTNIRAFIGSLVADYQHLVDYTNSKLSGDAQKLKGQSHISDTEDAVMDIDRKIESIDTKITPLKGKFEDKGKEYKAEVKKWYWMIVLLIGIASVELIANFDVFSTLGGGLISSLGIAMLTGICVYWYAHFTPDKIRKYGGDNPRKQMLLFFLFLIPIVTVFYFFSSLRIEYMIALNPEMAEVFNANPWIFTLINAFAYTISCMIIWAFKPSKEVILAYKKYRHDVKDIQVLEIEREVLCQKRASLHPELREKLSDKYQILLLGKQTEDEIVTRMKGCFEEFKMELYLKTNGACDALFTGDSNKDLPKLKLNYQSINQKFPRL